MDQIITIPSMIGNAKTVVSQNEDVNSKYFWDKVFTNSFQNDAGDFIIDTVPSSDLMGYPISNPRKNKLKSV